LRWRERDNLAAANRPDGIAVAAAVDRFIEGAEAGRAVNRSGRPYMPSALRALYGYAVDQGLAHAARR
jgi:hypothetical protein